MAKKGGMPRYKSVEDYIKNQAEERQSLLRELHQIVLETIAEAAEIPQSKVPSYSLIPEVQPQLHLMFSATAKSISFYPFEETVGHFKDELEGFELGKGTIKLPYSNPLPKSLIQQMILFRRDELLNANRPKM